MNNRSEEQLGYTPARIERLQHGLFVSPPPFNSLAQCGQGQTIFFAPFPSALCHPVNGESSCISTIYSLLLACRPSAVIWRVIAIVVNPVNTVIRRWSWSHVRIKRLKRLAPSFAYFYSSTSIIFIRLAAFAHASIDHAPPHSILHGPGAPMRSFALAKRVCPDAAAIRGQSSVQVMSGNSSFRSAFADTVPVCRAAFSKTQYSPFSEDSTRKVLKTWVSRPTIGFSHEMHLSLEGHLWLEPEWRNSATRLASFYHIAA